ncbi:LpqB family beta-propeller domain-containing protein [Nocardioides mangrovi]|uniref:LpqB family beta-propeller domain-containing protein n=1 Tax=Nocardioides mangrovi TaxID=2874580 RepID=A0ABS7U9I8_9ACTN|nr:LpqB family beta-propeller domain-containing protein [Nocardioides mangrovi]MBZ5737322.1 LpqB family beta-propeller domain-containing protein [Nocardioides mangrovi]
MSARRTPLVGVVLCAALLLSGCLSMPTSGPVVQTRSDGGTDRIRGGYIDPKPPQAGDTRAGIVRGFLEAMQAYPVQANTAKEFLSQDAAASWNPENQTITYADFAPLRETPNGVAVTLPDPHHLDAQGAWQGSLPMSERTIDFPMTYEDGEWRIDAAPDALIVPESWFEQRYQAASLYYFDPTAQILVPEPVYVSSGQQLASNLVQALLLGPGPTLDRVSQSFVPAGMKLSLSVDVSDDGIADIGLRGDAAQLTPQSTELMMVQLAWTLRQVRGITALRVSINTEALALPGGVSAYRIDGGAQYDPAGANASPLLYALRNGRLSSGASGGAIEPVSGPMGAAAVGIRTVGISLGAGTAAGVTDDGRSVLEAPVSGADKGKVVTAYDDGTDLLPPVWDFASRLWLVDRTPDGAVVSWVAGGDSQTVDIRGISGADVRSFTVSRDGTRLVAAVRRPAGFAVVVSRIAHNRNGRVLWATAAHTIVGVPDNDLPVRTVTWRSPTALAILSPFSSSLAQVGSATVDGSPAADNATRTVPGKLRDLAGSPSADDTVYGVTPNSLVDLSTSVPRASGLADGVTYVTYAGSG